MPFIDAMGIHISYPSNMYESRCDMMGLGYLLYQLVSTISVPSAVSVL